VKYCRVCGKPAVYDGTAVRYLQSIPLFLCDLCLAKAHLKFGIRIEIFIDKERSARCGGNCEFHDCNRCTACELYPKDPLTRAWMDCNQ